jgi:RES domain-containing protein
VILWRISNHLSLTGDGVLRASGRWHTRGRRVVYCAQTPAAALLEVLVHLEIEITELPARYRLLKLEAPDELVVARLAPTDLPTDWVENMPGTQAIGDAWLKSRRSPLFSVPSALVPETFNILLNPDHREARRVVVLEAREHVIDPRLLG